MTQNFGLLLFGVWRLLCHILLCFHTGAELTIVYFFLPMLTPSAGGGEPGKRNPLTWKKNWLVGNGWQFGWWTFNNLIHGAGVPTEAAKIGLKSHVLHHLLSRISSWISLISWIGWLKNVLLAAAEEKCLHCSQYFHCFTIRKLGKTWAKTWLYIQRKTHSALWLPGWA